MFTFFKTIRQRPFTPVVIFTILRLAIPLTSARGQDASYPPVRRVVVKGFAAYPPLFLAETKTLDPMDIAQECWKGYLTQQPDPWGMTPALNPTLRFHFDDRALPWPRLKFHEVDGFDNNARNVGAHAFLHEMLGSKKDDDPAERGQLAYLFSLSDPESGFAYGADNMVRHCPLAEGEETKNLLLLYQQTHNPILYQLATRMLQTLQRYAVVYESPGVGQVAAYCQGGNGGQGGFEVGEPPLRTTPDPTLGGWQYVYDGWAAWAFDTWYEMSGDKDSLQFSTALARRLCHSEDPHGADGSFRPDGSFGSTDNTGGGSWHMHGHTHCLPGLVLLGKDLMAAGNRDEGIAFIRQASHVMDWLYDPSRNRDAGSMTGWLGEWLAVASGSHQKADCEGCTMGDVTQTACALGAVSQLDPALGDLSGFYDRAEQIYRGEVMEQMFRVTPRYLEVLKSCLAKEVEKEMPNSSAQVKFAEVEKRFQQGAKTAERMTGQQMGLCGFPDWVNQLPSDLNSDLPGIHMQGCCADATIRATHAIWEQSITGDDREARVNLAFNRDSPLAKVVSCLPNRGELDIFAKTARRILVRIPTWAPRESVAAFVNKKAQKMQWKDNYVVFDDVASGDHLTVTYPLRLAEVTESIENVSYTEKWRGDTIVDINPPGKWIPKFQRPELESESVPE